MPTEPLTLLTDADFRRLLAACAHGPHPCRDRAILQLCWHGPATVRQIVDCRLSGVNFLIGRIVWDSGHAITLCPDALGALSTYIGMERDVRCPRLFSARHGRGITAGDVCLALRRLAAETGVPVDPPALRRSALYRLLRERPLDAFWAYRAHPRPEGEAPAEALAGP